MAEELRSHSMNPLFDRRLLPQKLLRDRTQLFGVFAEINQEVAPLFFPALGGLYRHTITRIASAGDHSPGDKSRATSS